MSKQYEKRAMLKGCHLKKKDLEELAEVVFRGFPNATNSISCTIGHIEYRSESLEQFLDELGNLAQLTDIALFMFDHSTNSSVRASMQNGNFHIAASSADSTWALGKFTELESLALRTQTKHLKARSVVAPILALLAYAGLLTAATLAAKGHILWSFAAATISITLGAGWLLALRIQKRANTSDVTLIEAPMRLPRPFEITMAIVATLGTIGTIAQVIIALNPRVK